ncbi:MAG: DUF4403 family protein [Bacteroidales bacterium]|jgi:hypothetical protein|nr:DUF4403 family protein [Bacteroidales bacterium]
MFAKLRWKKLKLKRISWKWVLPVLLVLLAGGGCRTIRVEKPAERYDAPEYHPQYSNINIPLEVNKVQLKKLVNRRLTGQLYADTSFEDNDRDNLMLFASRMDSIDVGFENDFLTYRVPLKIYLKKRTNMGIFGLDLYDITDANAEVVLKFKTKLNINRDWSLSTLTLPDGYEWISTPTVTLAGFQLPLPVISDVLLKGSLGFIAKGIDKSVKSAVDLRKIVGDAWIALQKPFLVSPGDSLWLKLSPAQLSSVPIQGKDGNMLSSLGLKALVELYWGREPAYTVNPELPPLRITSALPGQFNINISLDIPLSYINSLARTTMRGYTMAFKNYKVIVKDITIYGQGDNLIVELPVEGTVKGSIYLAGVPVFNKDSLTIELDNLDFSVSTKNVAVKTASWLFHSGLVQKLRTKLVFPVGEQLRSARESVAATLRENRSVENFRINGSIEKLEPEKIQITPQSVKAYFVFEGRVRVIFSGE